ncbi:MAG: LamG domain-containing protein, partial [Desulfobacteraceae bacterium]|nr:LamG domain-containing protein [Desulfobacteraceae bacterium]
MTVKMKQVSDKRNTLKKMETIIRTSKEYYKSNHDLFLANTEEDIASGIQIAGSNYIRYGKVPMVLNLEQKYKLDEFGKYFEYHLVEQGTDENAFTDIDGITVDGVSAAGVIISYGSNQVRDCIVPSNLTNSYVSGGDDILLPINVIKEARQIALYEMNVIRKKLWIFAITHPPGTSVPASFYKDYGLGEAYKFDPWGEQYILGTDFIKTSNEEMSLSLLGVSDDYGTDRIGKKPPPIQLAGSDFDSIVDGKVDFGSGGRFTGSVHGSVSESNGSLYFNRSAGGGYVLLGNQLDKYLGYNFTLSARIYPHDNQTKGARIFIKDERHMPAIQNPTGWGLSLADSSPGVDRTGVLRFYARAFKPMGLYTPKVIPERQWRHVVAVAEYDEASKTTDKHIYVDGNLAATEENLPGFIPDNDAPLAIGGDPNSAFHRFDGLIK